MTTSFQPGKSQVAWSPPLTHEGRQKAHVPACKLFQREAVKDAFPRRVARGPLLQWQIDPRSKAKIAYELYADGRRLRIPASEWGAAAWFKRRWGSFNES
jgi:hypothetical protein